MVLRRTNRSLAQRKAAAVPSLRRRGRVQSHRSLVLLIVLGTCCFLVTVLYAVWKIRAEPSSWEWYEYDDDDAVNNETSANPVAATAQLLQQEQVWKAHVQQLHGKVQELQLAMDQQQAHQVEQDHVLQEQMQEHTQAVHELEELQKEQAVKKKRNVKGVAKKGMQLGLKGGGMKKKKKKKMKKGSP
jgi:hypothetical protein